MNVKVINYCCHSIELRDCEQCSRALATEDQLMKAQGGSKNNPQTSTPNKHL